MTENNKNLTLAQIEKFKLNWKATTLRLKSSGYDLSKIYLVKEGTDYDARTGKRYSENNH